MAATKQKAKSKALQTPDLGQLVECRGATWRYLGEQKGFWHLELVKEGAQFAENPIQVWALPHLESKNLKLIDSSTALAPLPTSTQKAKGKHLKPFIQSKRNHTLEDAADSAIPQTALNCAIDHKAWQFEPWQRIASSLPFPRILIADDVGLGKTTEAAIILAELTRRRRAERVLIITPQHLTEKWQDELYERFGLPFEIYHRDTRVRLSDRGVKNPWEVVERVIVSRDFVKRWENLKALKNVSWDMVIIDECHHFVKDNNQAPTRLRELAEEIVYKSPGLILLSATPFTGSKSEFHSLLRLLDPKFHDSETAQAWDPNNPYLIRRLKGHVKDKGEKINDRKIVSITVSDEDLSKNESSLLQDVSIALAEYKKSPGAESWDRLLEETARKRLSSSWSAFHETIRGSDRIGQWFSEKLKSKVQEFAESNSSSKIKALTKTLHDIHKNDKAAKVVIFTEAIATQKSISIHLVDTKTYQKDEVAEIKADTPREQRLEIEDQFANPESKLKVLIATDTISEGKDLQHACNHLIHFELPWSLVKIEQRNGRIDRLGQSKTPHIYNLVFNTKATPDQNVLKRLMEKLEKAKDALGSVSPIIASFDSIHGEDLFAKDAEKNLSQIIDSTTTEAKEFGFDLSNITTLSSAPIEELADYDARRLNIKLMLESLGGKLEPYGKADDQFLISLPSDPVWDLPALESMGEVYPDVDHPWRVTFAPKVYLDYEHYRRVNGESRMPMHFLSPVHPICTQIEGRFRNKTAQSGYPIFAVENAAHDFVIVAELTARSPSSRIINQKLVAFELKRFQELPLDVLSQDLRGVESTPDIPETKTWKGVEAKLTEMAGDFVKSVKKSFDLRRASLVVEQNSISADIKGHAERQQWIQDLWNVDQNQAQYQIIALLVAKRS